MLLCGPYMGRPVVKINLMQMTSVRQNWLFDYIETLLDAGLPFTLLRDWKNLPAHSWLLKLAPEYEANSVLIWVEGRLHRCDSLNNDVLHSIVLLPDNLVSKLLIKHYDTQLYHPGVDRVYAELCRKFWGVHGRETIKKHQHGSWL